jgi:hypothetical protein
MNEAGRFGRVSGFHLLPIPFKGFAGADGHYGGQTDFGELAANVEV